MSQHPIFINSSPSITQKIKPPFFFNRNEEKDEEDQSSTNNTFLEDDNSSLGKKRAAQNQYDAELSEEEVNDALSFNSSFSYRSENHLVTFEKIDGNVSVAEDLGEFSEEKLNNSEREVPSKIIEHLIRRKRTAIHKCLYLHFNKLIQSRFGKEKRLVKVKSDNMTQITTFYKIKEWNGKNLKYILSYKNPENEKLIEKIKEKDFDLFNKLNEMTLGEFIDDVYYESDQCRKFIRMKNNLEADAVFMRKYKFSLIKKGGYGKYLQSDTNTNDNNTILPRFRVNNLN